jgi:hypothetical protein
LEGIAVIMEGQILAALEKDIKVEVRALRFNLCNFLALM